MSNEQQKHIIPHIRTFKIENIPRVKISLFDEKSKLEINRIFIPIDSNISPEKDDKIQVIQSSDDQNSLPKFLSQQQLENPTVNIPSQSQPIINPIDHQKAEIVAYNRKQHLQPSSSIDFINEHQASSPENTNKTKILSSVIGVEQSLSPPLSQLFPDSIINDKQATNRILNEKNSTQFTHPSKFITLTPVIIQNNSSEKKTTKSIDDDLLSSNHVRYYQIGSIFTSTSTFIMHQNRVIAHANASNPFLSDTIFIILIASLTIIILLFCLGLFCLCRRTTKRNISPSFDGSSYAGLNGHSYEMPINDYQQRTDLPSSSIQTKSSINQPILINDRIPLSQPIALHQTAKQKIKMNKKNLKKKRVGCCCCNSKQTSTTGINARTRM